MTNRRRSTLIVVSALLGTAALVALSALFGDIEPPDDSDLVFKPREIAREDNGYFDVAVEEEFETPDEVYDLVWAYLAGRELTPDETMNETPVRWNGERVDELLADFAPHLERLERSLARPEFQFPAEVFGWHGWFDLQWLLQLRSCRLLEQDRHRDAIDVGVAAVRFWHRMETAGNAFSQGYKSGAIDHVRELVLRSSLTHDELPSIIGRLAAMRVTPVTHRAMIRAGYKFAVEDLLEDWHESLCIEGTLGFDVPEDLVRVAYQPNRTRKWFADYYRHHIELVAVPPARRRPAPDPEGGPLNIAGRALYRMYCSDGETLVTRGQIAYELKLTAIAVEAFRREHDRIPGRLDELVPTYFPEVPRDPHDGEPLGYAAEYGTLSSRGGQTIGLESEYATTE